MTASEKKIKKWKEILRKLKKRREKGLKLETLAAKRRELKRRNQEAKYRKEERDFRLLLKKDAIKTRQMIIGYQSRISSFERKLDQIIKKNKLKS